MRSGGLDVMLAGSLYALRGLDMQWYECLREQMYEGMGVQKHKHMKVQRGRCPEVQG
jgi:hypothetical protein